MTLRKTKTACFAVYHNYLWGVLVPKRSLLPRCPREVWETLQLRVKSRIDPAENVEICDEGDLLSVLLQEEIAFLIDERRDKEVKDIFNNKMGVIPGGYCHIWAI